MLSVSILSLGVLLAPSGEDLRVHLPGRDTLHGGAPRLHVVNGVSRDVSALYLTSTPRVEPNIAYTSLLGVIGRARQHGGRLWSVVSRPTGAGATLFGGLTLSDGRTGKTVGWRNLAGHTHNPMDVVFTEGGEIILSNFLSFDSDNEDYRLTVLDKSSLQVLGELPLINPFLASPDPSMGPNGMTIVGDLLFVCCSGYSRTSFEYVNPGSIAVIDLRTWSPVDTDGDPGNGMTPLFTLLPNPGRVALGPDNRLYVQCGGNFGVFSGRPSISGGVEIFDLADFSRLASLDLGGDASVVSMAFMPDGRLYLGDGVVPWIYSIDIQEDVVLRSFVDPIRLPQVAPYGMVADFHLLEDGRVLALSFNEATVEAWFLSDDLNTGDPGLMSYADLDPFDSGFPGPLQLIPAIQ